MADRMFYLFPLHFRLSFFQQLLLKLPKPGRFTDQQNNLLAG
jgi:hypothetical protein